MKQIIFILTSFLFVSILYGQQVVDRVNPFPKTITVSGSSEMEIIPDEIYVVVSLREYEKRGQGKVDLETIKSSFLKSCREIGLPDSAITIASYEGASNPWLRKKKKTDLYSSIDYEIKFTNSTDMDKLVDKLDDDATQNFQVVKTSHSRIMEFRKQLKIQAIKAAKEKGGYLTEAIGEKLGEAVNINEPDENQGEYYNLPVMSNQVLSQYRLNENGGSTSTDKSLSVDFKKIKLRFQVTVVFALK